MLILKKYSNQINELKPLVLALGIELYGKEPNVELYLSYHEDSVWILYDGETAVGFFSWFLTDNCGFGDEQVFCDFMYIKKEYRAGIGFSIMMKKILDIALEKNIEISIGLSSHTAKQLAKKGKAKFVFNIVEFSMEQIKDWHRRTTKITKQRK